MFNPRALGIAKFGVNRFLTAAADVWSAAGDYTFATSPETLYLSSASTLDTAVSVTVIGLDATGKEVSDTKTTNGYSGVALDGTWLRVYRAYVVGTTAPVGDLYVGTEASPGGGIPVGANKRAQIPLGANQTLMAITTVPAQVDGKTIRTAFISDMLLTILPGSPAGVQVEYSLYVRSQGGLFTAKSSLGMTDSQPALYRPFPKAIEVAPLSDIKLRIDSVSASTTKVSGEFAVFYE